MNWFKKRKEREEREAKCKAYDTLINNIDIYNIFLSELDKDSINIINNLFEKMNKYIDIANEICSSCEMCDLTFDILNSKREQIQEELQELISKINITEIKEIKEITESSGTLPDSYYKEKSRMLDIDMEKAVGKWYGDIKINKNKL